MTDSTAHSRLSWLIWPIVVVFAGFGVFAWLDGIPPQSSGRGAASPAFTLTAEEQAQVEQLRTGQYIVIDERLYETAAKAHRELAATPQIGRFQTLQIGVRTYRFDSATGQACLLLTTEAEWKRPDAGGCQIEEAPSSSTFKVVGRYNPETGKVERPTDATRIRVPLEALTPETR